MTRRRSVARTRRSITVSFDGRRRAFGRIFSMLSPLPAGHRPKFLSIRRQLRHIGVPRVEKGGVDPGHRSLKRRTHHEDTRLDRSLLPPHCLLVDRWPSGRLHGCRHPPGPDARNPGAAWRQGVLYQRRTGENRGHGAAPNIPPKTSRRWKPYFSPVLYRNRNAIKRMLGRLKDFRRIATRYERLEQNFLAAVCLSAIVCYWL